MKPHRPKGGWYSYPSPDECILDMINSQLEVSILKTFWCRRLFTTSLSREKARKLNVSVRIYHLEPLILSMLPRFVLRFFRILFALNIFISDSVNNPPGKCIFNIELREKSSRMYLTLETAIYFKKKVQ